jgi:hypothetical protein
VGVLIARTPFKCPAAPYEAAFLIDEVLRKEGVRERVELGVYTPEWQPMLAAGDEVGSMLVVQERNSLQHRKNGAQGQHTKETSAL